MFICLMGPGPDYSVVFENLNRPRPEEEAEKPNTCI